jgi:hypothetical protein
MGNPYQHVFSDEYRKRDDEYSNRLNRRLLVDYSDADRAWWLAGLVTMENTTTDSARPGAPHHMVSWLFGVELFLYYPVYLRDCGTLPTDLICFNNI